MSDLTKNPPSMPKSLSRDMFTLLYAAFMTGWLSRPYAKAPSEALAADGRKAAAAYATKILTAPTAKPIAIVPDCTTTNGDSCDPCNAKPS